MNTKECMDSVIKEKLEKFPTRQDQTSLSTDLVQVGAASIVHIKLHPPDVNHEGRDWVADDSLQLQPVEVMMGDMEGESVAVVRA